LQVEALAGGIGGDHDADIMVGDHPLQRLAVDAHGLAVAVETAAVGPGIETDDLGRELSSHGIRYPAGGVAVLAENDRAEFQPALLLSSGSSESAAPPPPG
jgi:hypothetical protein